MPSTLAFSQLVLINSFWALAPKSNSVIKGIDGALRDVRKGEIGTVPLHLKDSHYPGAAQLGHGQGYLYPHDYPGHFIKQQYLPDKLKNKKYYFPSGEGLEKNITVKNEEEEG